ncbi:hypothetical protein HaLaN_25397 [Haematococcus lacustris]|uniref:Uncharacterized protein n=1 Tax=Haematococcus lacustris TaxID=44745 RepID=A0A6A0A4E7_HAELA|nr:hypothetical protein HaLaN_25397 [Haematococcus lacustris]
MESDDAGRGQLQPAHGPEAADSLLSRVLQRPTSSLLLLQQLEQLALAVQHSGPTAPRAVADLAPSLTPPPQPTLVPQLPWPQHWEGNSTLTQITAEAPAAAKDPLLAPLPSCLSDHLHSPFAQGLSSSHCLAALQLLAAARDLLKCDHCQLEPLVLEEPASLALFCTGLAPDLGPAPEGMTN